MHTRGELTLNQVNKLVAIRSKIIRPQPDVGPVKATQENGVWKGGISFERTEHAHSFGNAPRCHNVSIVNQMIQNMAAPEVQSKMSGMPQPPELRIRWNLIHAGAINAIGGMKKDPEGIVQVLEHQASFTNLPRVGSQSNVCFPNFQLSRQLSMIPTPIMNRARF